MAKPFKPPKPKSENAGRVVPPGYTPPPEPVEPEEADLEDKRNDIKNAIKDVIEAATKPLTYEAVYERLRNNNVDMKWLRHEIMYLISEVDETYNPGDFTAEG